MYICLILKYYVITWDLEAWLCNPINETKINTFKWIGLIMPDYFSGIIQWKTLPSNIIASIKITAKKPVEDFIVNILSKCPRLQTSLFNDFNYFPEVSLNIKIELRQSFLYKQIKGLQNCRNPWLWKCMFDKTFLIWKLDIYRRRA